VLSELHERGAGSRIRLRLSALWYATPGPKLRALKFLRLQFAEIMIGIYRYNGRFFTTRPSRIELAQGGPQRRTVAA